MNKWWPLRRNVEKRAVSFQDFWGSGADIDSVRGNSIDQALTLAPVFAATRLIADSIASLPLDVYRKSGDTRTEVPTPSLFTEPTIFGGRYEWVQRSLISLLLKGNAYGLVTAVSADGWPSQIEWLDPNDVAPVDNSTTGRPQWRVSGRPVDPWLGRDSGGELFHIPWYVLPGQILGMSPIRAFASTIEGGIYAQRFGRDFFRNGAVPSAVLESDSAVDQADATTIKARFLAAAQGRAPVVLGAGTTYKPITVPPEESQFLETIKANATTIASIFGVPPEMIGGESGGSMTYANVEQWSLNFVMHSLRPYLTKLECAFSTLLPRPQYARFNVDALLRADLKTRYEAHAIALNPTTGWMRPEEVRAIEDLPPVAEDKLRRPVPAPPPLQPDPKEQVNGRH